MSQIGILAYGSLIEDPGHELKVLITNRLEKIQTPFNIEFARSSRSRGGAPTVIPVEQGGAPASAVILLLAPETSPENASNSLWRRETANTNSEKNYNPHAQQSDNSVIIKQLRNFFGVDLVLYTHIGENISIRTPSKLAELAIASVQECVKSGKKGRDGISYLMSLKRQGIITPLMDSYENEILTKLNARNLNHALDICSANN